MHKGRIELLERVKKVEDELFSAICDVEDLFGYINEPLASERRAVSDAMAIVYRIIMFIDDDKLTQ